MTPCSLANVHRWVWKKGGGIDERRERKDSSQVRKNKRAWKRRKKHVIELKYSLKEESRKKREKNTFVNTLQRLASASLTTHTPHPPVVLECLHLGRGLPRTLRSHWSKQGRTYAVSKAH